MHTCMNTEDRNYVYHVFGGHGTKGGSLGRRAEQENQSSKDGAVKGFTGD